MSTVQLNYVAAFDEATLQSKGVTLCPMFHDVSGTCYGHQLKSKYFLLADNYTNMNHGSYGTLPKSVAKAQKEFVLQQESHPDHWFRQNVAGIIDKSRQVIADILSISIEDLVLVENASAAVNSILRSMVFKKGDRVLRLSTAYGMVVSTMEWLEQVAGIEVIVVQVEFPVTSPDQIIHAMQEAIATYPDIKLCLFSHISSVPAMMEPVEALTKLAKSIGSLVIIDGAHAPGEMDIDLSAINPDFYLGNLHKWMFAPKGSAFLYVSKQQQSALFPEPTVISSENVINQSILSQRFEYTGTRDYTAFASIPAAFEFIDQLGGLSQIVFHNHELAIIGSKLLAQKWNTGFLIALEMSASMTNVIVPSHDLAEIDYVQKALDQEFNIYVVYSSVVRNAQGKFVVPGRSYKTGGVEEAVKGSSDDNLLIYFRLSAQVYLELSDYERLAELVPTLIQRYRTQNIRQSS